MSLGKPQSVEIDVWEKVVKEEQRKNPKVRYEEILLGVVRFKVVCMINNFHKYGFKDRYTIIYCQDVQIIPSLFKREDLQNFGTELPDLYDELEKRFITIKFVTTSSGEKTQNPFISRSDNEMVLELGMNGEVQESFKLLDESQIMDIKNILVLLNEEFNTMQVLENVDKFISSGYYHKITVGRQFKNMLLRKTDLDFIPKIVEDEDLQDPKMKPWSKMENLPKLEIKGGKESCWRAFLIGSESEYLLYEDVDDQTVVNNFFSEYPTFEILRNNGSFGQNEVKSILLSVSDFCQGNMRRHKIQEDIKGFGINTKLRKKLSNYSNEKWETFGFNHELRSPPTWMENEIMELSKSEDCTWIEFDNLKEYTKLDAVAEGGVNKYLDYISGLKTSSLIEKWTIACSKLQNELHTDRNKITLIPIITRRKILGKRTSQLWGFISLGPHHPRHDSDRIPLLTLEFCRKDDITKYEKFSYGVLKSKLLGVNEEICFMGRVYSMAKYKLFYFSHIRKVLLQPLNIFSKVLLTEAADKGEFNPNFNPVLKIHYQKRLISINLKNWIKMVLATEFVMCIHNDSQMEGFLANMRRLQMCRHALQERREIYLPIHGRPEDKCSECVLNNPMVLHLAKTWNDLPVIH